MPDSTHPAPRQGLGRPIPELRDSGLLWLINRVVFHPRGLAFALHADSTGQMTGWSLQGDGSEAWSFPEEVDQGHFRNAEATLRAARAQDDPPPEPEPTPRPEPDEPLTLPDDAVTIARTLAGTSGCQTIDVDGEPVRVQAAGELSAELETALADVARTVRANHPPVPLLDGERAQEHDDLTRELAETLGVWFMKNATVCEHTQIISYGEAADALMKVVGPRLEQLRDQYEQLYDRLTALPDEQQVREQVAADLKRAAAGRRDYASRAPKAMAAALEAEAAAYDTAARVAETPNDVMWALLPLAMWTEADRRGEPE